MNQEKGTKYELYIKQFLENDSKKTWLWNDIPEYELRKSNLLGDWNEHRLTRKENKINSIPDLGTDILLKDEEKYILIQCKNFESNNYVTIHHLAGFYAMISHFKMEGIVYYTSKLSPNIKLLRENSEIQYIKQEIITNNTNEKKKNNEKKLINNPYYYQVEAYDKLKNSHRAILSLPCGMGKTLTSIMISKDYDNIILISPLIVYSKQNLDRFKDELDNYNDILINSEGTRDKDEILKKILNNKKNILSFTYKSVDILIDILNLINNKIVIIDEFHNLSKNDLFDENTPFYKLLHSNSKILFMSATPKFFNLDDVNYNNKDIFGEDNYYFPMSKGISEKHICDYEIYLPDIRTKNNIDDILEEISIKDLDQKLSIKAKFILRGMIETGAKKCIIYLRNQKETREMIHILKKLNEYYYVDLYLESILSDNTLQERVNILNNFKTFNGYSIICSVEILDESVDILECDSNFITYPSESKTRNVQRICRGNRKNKFDIHKITKIFLWCEEYDEISIFISQLKEFDENFQENKISILNINQSEGGILERNKKEYQGLYKNLDDVIISIRKFGYGIDKWMKNLEELKEFIKIKKPLSKSLDLYEKKIGKWLESQVFDFKHNLNIMKLPQIQELWKTFTKENKDLFILPNELWINHLNNLEEYITKNNRLPTQGSTENEESFKLAKWIVRNNDEYAKNEKAMKDEIVRNQWTEFKNKYSSLFNEKVNEWINQYNLVNEFILKNGKLPVENKDRKAEYNLRIWLKTQEKIYNKNKFENDIDKRIHFEILFNKYQHLFSKVSNLELWINKYDQFIEYIEKNNQLPKEKIKIDDNISSSKREELESLKSLGIWKSNLIQNAKINFVTHIEDFDISKMSSVEKEKHEIKLKKYHEDIEKDNNILSKDYSKLSKKDKTLYDKVNIKVDERNKRIKEEKFETSEKLRLLNEVKIRFPKLF